MQTFKTTCCVVGGGPAGVMLGFLLARAGVRVTVLEKHPDFNRDFRGDTVHPSTLTVMHELGLLKGFLKMPHQEVRQLGGVFGNFRFTLGDFHRVPSPCKFVALMPQWDFLNFLTGHARRFSGFDLRMGHEATGLMQEGERVVGVRAQTGGEPIEIETDLVVGCDGRHAITRKAANLDVEEIGVPIDVLWFHLSRQPGDPDESLGHINYGKLLILINRGDYFQCGLVVRKGSFEELKRAGLEAFRKSVTQVAPFLGTRSQELTDWDHVKLLSIQINRLHRWHRPGLLCIGDCAHAMSPVGGVGINLALQDSIAAANILAAPLAERRVNETLLARVQTRREWPTRVTQAVQMRAHKGLESVFRNPGPAHAPWQLKAAVGIPGLQHAVARVVGIGFRPEHIRTPEVPQAANR